MYVGYCKVTRLCVHNIHLVGANKLDGFNIFFHFLQLTLGILAGSI